mmetsp:Transcript_53125/g.77626  ORF Transcript_53125/g.77626 Transcript_53125/m.77626 type:complete len:95 (+) Transcript_53125:590-874(+)
MNSIKIAAIADIYKGTSVVKGTYCQDETFHDDFLLLEYYSHQCHQTNNSGARRALEPPANDGWHANYHQQESPPPGYGDDENGWLQQRLLVLDE